MPHHPPLDPDFLPIARWNRDYRADAGRAAGSRTVHFTLARPDGQSWTFMTPMLPDLPEHAERNWRYAERLVKTLLWARGGSRIRVQGAREIVSRLKLAYRPEGARAFDYDFIGKTCFGEAMNIGEGRPQPRAAHAPGLSVEHNLKGCRIGFDLGGSDRKCAALIDGEVVYSEEIKWDPYFQADPAYHLEGIRDSLQLAAAWLPRVDAIGGSAAGIYINNEPRAGSLFRGVSPEDFDRSIRGLFRQLQQEWDGVPFAVANDGDVTALAGAMSLKANAVLGISMGTSLAAGYVDPQGELTGWLNELAFVPVDAREDAPADEWSGDHGCGVQYFSQQAVARLIPASGLTVDERASLPERLEAVQSRMADGDERAAALYRTIGVYFGHTLAHFSDFYDFTHLLLLGRVSSGEGGRIILDQARLVLRDEFPELTDKIQLDTPDEQMKRHGQAIAAASLPRL